MKLSIITVVRNDRAGFETTADSLFAQTIPENIVLEYLVVDGASTDGTAEAIRERDDKIDWWTSEADTGIYNAMNKAVDHATGEALLFLNAGDYFVGEVLPFVGTQAPPFFLPVKYRDVLGRFRERPLMNVRTGIPNCHQGIVFQNRQIRYDETYTIGADYDYYLKHGYPSRLPVIDCDGYVFFDNSGTNARNVDIRDQEIFEIRRKYFGTAIAYVFELYPLLKRAVRRMFGLNVA